MTEVGTVPGLWRVVQMTTSGTIEELKSEKVLKSIETLDNGLIRRIS